jgi:hypothetical protein
MTSRFSKFFAMALLVAFPSLLPAQTLNPAQMPPSTVTNFETSGSGAATNSEATITLPAPTAPVAVTNTAGDSVIVGANGIYSVRFASPAWTFTTNQRVTK